MAFFNRAGNILIRRTNEMSYIHQTIRSVSNWKVFVRGLGPATNVTSLRKAFSAHGKVSKAKIIMDRKTGRCRGFGFVTFADYVSACHAIDTMDQWELDGQTVTVRWANDSCGDLVRLAWGSDLSRLSYESIYIQPGQWCT